MMVSESPGLLTTAQLSFLLDDMSSSATVPDCTPWLGDQAALVSPQSPEPGIVPDVSLSLAFLDDLVVDESLGSMLGEANLGLKRSSSPVAMPASLPVPVPVPAPVLSLPPIMPMHTPPALPPPPPPAAAGGSRAQSRRHTQRRGAVDDAGMYATDDAISRHFPRSVLRLPRDEYQRLKQQRVHFLNLRQQKQLTQLRRRARNCVYAEEKRQQRLADKRVADTGNVQLRAENTQLRQENAELRLQIAAFEADIEE